VGASPEPASTLACPEPPPSNATVNAPATTTATPASAAPTNFTPRRLVRVRVRFVFMSELLRSHHRICWVASVSSLTPREFTGRSQLLIVCLVGFWFPGDTSAQCAILVP
jgi:hypothetical protein